MRVVLEAFGKGFGWYYYHNHYRYRLPQIRRPELVEIVRNLVKDRPVTYGYRRVHALIRQMGIRCDAKTIHRYMSLKLWLSSNRQKQKAERERRDGVVAVEEPNTRWASDITVIKAWNGEKGRLCIIIDCADRQIVGYRWGTSIKGDDISEVVKGALLKRFEAEKAPRKGALEFLSDNGSEYIKKEFRGFLEKAGFVVCNTPVRSPESNGIAEAFFKSFKRDYVWQDICETFESIGSKIPGWIEDYNTRAPHSALGMLTPVKFFENWKLKSGK